MDERGSGKEGTADGDGGGDAGYECVVGDVGAGEDVVGEDGGEESWVGGYWGDGRGGDWGRGG
jgi:hypothetical protein